MSQISPKPEGIPAWFQRNECSNLSGQTVSAQSPPDTPLVSVNVTTYNRAHLLPRALDSVSRQSYRNMEIIVVDDGSKDNTPDVVNRYRQKDPRIRYYRHDTNKGNASARNTAFKNCTGYYVAFMDDDDEWIDSDKVKKQIELFGRLGDHVGIICSSVTIVGQDGIARQKPIRRPTNLTRHILGGNGIIYSPTVMTKRSVMLQADGFDEKMPRGVDSDFYRTCIVKHGYDVHFMAETTTAVHEYGSDRITPVADKSVVMRTLAVNFYLVKKYFRYYMVMPQSLARRLKTMLALAYKLVRLQIKGGVN